MNVAMRKKTIMLVFTLLTAISIACTQSVTDKIVIVGIASYDKTSIAKQIQNICALNPKVIAVDVQFPERDESYEDTLLRSALSSCSEVVLPSQIRAYTYDDKDYQDTLGCDPFFLVNAKTGFVNVILEYDEFYTLRRFSIKEKVNGKIEYHFAIQTAMRYDSLRTAEFIRNNPKIIDIKYQRDQTTFKTIRASYALFNELSRDEIEDKIVLLGSFWPIEGYAPDVFVSPLNNTPEKGADMWGVMYLANIVAQVLE